MLIGYGASFLRTDYPSIIIVSHLPFLLLSKCRAPEIDMSELENLFSAAVPTSGIAKKSNVQSSAGPKSEKVQLVIIFSL